MNDGSIFKEFVKHHIPIFAFCEGYEDEYIFCNYTKCSECKIKDIYSCKNIPTIKKVVITEYLKEHPEHGI